MKDAAGTGSLNAVVQAAAGNQHILYLTELGEVVGTGDNSWQALGNSVINGSYLPSAVRNAANTGNLAGIVQVAAGGNASAALTDDGKVYAWGYASGNGNPATSTNNYPAFVKKADGTDLSGIVRIAVGRNSGYALTAAGEVYGWGSNNEGQLGRGTFNTSGPELFATPVLTAANTPVTDIVSIAAGYQIAGAINAAGELYLMGRNDAQQFHTNYASLNRQTFATKVKSTSTATLTGVSSVALGGSHIVVLKTDGSVLTWGLGTNGQLGQGTAGSGGGYLTDRAYPAPVVGTAGTGQLGSIVSIAAGQHHSLALAGSGQIHIWGAGYSGNLGQGGASSTHTLVPVVVKNTAGTGDLSLGALGVFKNLLQRGR